jgi:hypothetical protein
MKSAFSDAAANVPGKPKMWDHLSFVIKRLRERLWIKPLIICVLSIGAVFLANLMDKTELGRFVPEITKESIETLLEIMASSMLVIATFAVASMVSAYASASSSATPRSFPLIIADDVSQNALSAFIGAFIYSVVAIVALMNGHYQAKAGLFTLFVLTMGVFAVIIVTFIWWVDRQPSLHYDPAREVPTGANALGPQMISKFMGTFVVVATKSSRAFRTPREFHDPQKSSRGFLKTRAASGRRARAGCRVEPMRSLA